MIALSRDLRSDALTRPTEAMWRAMREHEPGWAPFGDDDAVAALEARAAEVTGMEAALLVPTGAMANLVALLVHTRPGEALVADEAAHVVRSEHAGYAAIAGLSLRPVRCPDGHLTAADVEAAVAHRPGGRPQRAGLVWLEQTHGAAGGTVQPAAELNAAGAAAAALGVPVHLDGARLPNAAVALGVAMADLAAAADSVTLNLNKGLGAPLGAVLCGSGVSVAAAREALGRVGGASVHQAGVWAAAGLLALEPAAVARLADDHAVARRLTAGLARLDGVGVRHAGTNIVLVDLVEPGSDAAPLADALRRQGVGAYAVGPRRLRFVTHRHVGPRDADAVVDAVAHALAPGHDAVGVAPTTTTKEG